MEPFEILSRRATPVCIDRLADCIEDTFCASDQRLTFPLGILHLAVVGVGGVEDGQCRMKRRHCTNRTLDSDVHGEGRLTIAMRVTEQIYRPQAQDLKHEADECSHAFSLSSVSVTQ